MAMLWTFVILAPIALGCYLLRGIIPPLAVVSEVPDSLLHLIVGGGIAAAIILFHNKRETAYKRIRSSTTYRPVVLVALIAIAWEFIQHTLHAEEISLLGVPIAEPRDSPLDIVCTILGAALAVFAYLCHRLYRFTVW